MAQWISNSIKALEALKREAGTLFLSFIVMFLMNGIGWSAWPTADLLTFQFVFSLAYLLVVQLIFLQLKWWSLALVATQVLLVAITPLAYLHSWSHWVIAIQMILLVIQTAGLALSISWLVFILGIVLFALCTVVLPDWTLNVWRELVEMIDYSGFNEPNLHIMVIFSINVPALAALASALFWNRVNKQTPWVSFAHLLILSFGLFGSLLGAVGSTA